VPLATLVAALAQLAPVHDAAPAAIVGTVHVFAVQVVVAVTDVVAARVSPAVQAVQMTSVADDPAL